MESMDDATEALRRKIDEMLGNSNSDSAQINFNPASQKRDSAKQEENRDAKIMEGVERLDQIDIAEFLKRSRKPNHFDAERDEQQAI